MQNPSPVGISSSLDHSQAGLKKSAIKTTRSRCNIHPSNGAVYSPENQIKITLPQRGFMSGPNTYLKFQVNLTGDGSGNWGYLDHSAFSFIQRAELFSAGALIESIDRYHVLAACLMDVFYDTAGQQGLASGYLGTEGISATGVPLSKSRMGREIKVNANGTATYTFCLPILSSIFSLAEKDFPLFKVSDLEVVLTLASQNDPWYLLYSQAWTISQVELVTEIVEPADMRAVASLYPETIVIPTTSYRCFVDSIAASPAAVTTVMQLPFRGSSAKNLLLAFRNKLTGAVNEYNICSRQHVLSSLQMKIGGLSYPSKPIQATATDTSEVCAELVKSFHAFGKPTAMGGLINYASYVNGAGGTGATGWYNGALYGIELDSFFNKSDTILSGCDLSTVTTFVEINQLAGTVASEVDMFVLHDLLVYVQPTGQVVTRF